MRPSSVLIPLFVILTALGLCDAQLLHHHFGKKLLGKKIFKKLRALDQCEVVWEEISHPHCETTWEKECEPWTTEECSIEKVEQCKDVVERNCKVEHKEQCTTEYMEKCETVGLQQCEEISQEKCQTDWVDECWEEDQEKCTTKKECSTKNQNVCSKVFKWVCTKRDHQEEPSLLHDHGLADSILSNPIRSLLKRSIEQHHEQEEEDSMIMFEKFEKLPTKELLRLVDEMTEDDFLEEKEEETRMLEAKVERSKRSALASIAGAIGISALYSKFLSTQDNCYRKKMPHCAEVPVDSCYDVQQCHTMKVPRCKKEAVRKCWEEPQQRCWTEPKENCWQEPEESCWQVPHENCWDETVQKCWEQPQQNCQQVEDQKCVEVPREHCKDVPVKVARKYCKDKKNPIETLTDLVL